MKHFRLILPLLILALLLSGCAGEPEPYEYTSGGATVTVDPINQTITNGQEIFTYVIVDVGAGDRYEITFPDGSLYYWTDSGNGGSGGWSDTFDTDRTYADFLVDALRQSVPREKVGSPVKGLLLMGLGALNFFLPQLPFYLRYGWAVKDAEPSEAYLGLSKAGGVLLAVAGLIFCFV